MSAYVDIAIRGVGRREQFGVNDSADCITLFTTSATGTRPSQRQAIHIYVDAAAAADVYFITSDSSSTPPTLTTARASFKLSPGGDRIFHADLNTHVWALHNNAATANVEVVEYR